MKRLLDESTDELTRSLLRAGVEHRPPPGNKAQVMLAIGAGSAFGLFSSNAFAWLGTTAGKVTAAGVAVGVAGAVFVAAPGWGNKDAGAAAGERAARSAVALRADAPAVQPALPTAAEPEPAVLSPTGGVAARAEAESPMQASSETWAASDAERLAEVPASRASGERRKKASSKKRVASRKRGAATEPALADGDVLAAAALPSAAGSSEVEAAEAQVGGTASDSSALDTEVRLVDDMHWAARRNDRVALGRFVNAYRETFPEGQLKKEVAEFEARLERSDSP
jgi:hypothetical protein